MPDILIRGMEMPHNCFQCPLFSNCDACEGHECGCGLLGGIGYEEDISEDRRRDDCPLIELPPHGDLIDRRELLSTVMQVVTKFPTNNIAAIEHLDLVSALLRGATVVVPAERRDADA